MKTFNVLRSDGSIAIVDADYIKVREGVLSACKIVTLSSTSMGDTVVYLSVSYTHLTLPTKRIV